MIINYKRIFTRAMIFLAVILSGFSAWSQQDQSAAVKKSADTLNAKIEQQSLAVKQSADTLNNKIENLKTDFDFMKKLKISGYIQAQWQLADTAGQLSPFSGGAFPKNSDNRFMVRRGRLKATYEGKLSQYVLQIDATQNGVVLKDAYINFKDPWLQMFMLQAGVFDRPFGFEVHYSSSLRESPERARVTQTLFPQERDLGAMLTIQPRKDSRFNFIRLNAALVNGNGISTETDSRKDFIGQLGINKTTANEKFRYAVGVSYYNGGVFQETKKIYGMATLADGITKGFVVDSTAANKGEYAKREYFGADAQLSLDWKPGITSIRGEYIWGTQPGSSKINISPAGRVIPDLGVSDTYNRKFSGGYVYLIQNIMHSRHEVVVKYDFLDPNTDVKGTNAKSEVIYNGNTLKTGLSIADVAYTTWGIGYNVRPNPNLKLMAFYEFVKNETTAIKGFTDDVKDNVFTLRAQFKF
jgi:phosphate-selective porin